MRLLQPTGQPGFALQTLTKHRILGKRLRQSLTATVHSLTVCSASYTSPIPPLPNNRFR